MQDDFSAYEALQARGVAPEEVYRAALRDGLDPIAAFRMLRKVFKLDFVQTKEVVTHALEGRSLNDHQRAIADSLEGFVPEDDKP